MKTKSNLKTSVKRLACGMLSAILLIPASAFAADTVTVESPVIDILASTNAAEHPAEAVYNIIKPSDTQCTVENGVYTPTISTAWGSYSQLQAEATALSKALTNKNKIVLEFDIKTLLGDGIDNSKYNTWHIRKDGSSSTYDKMAVWQRQLKFTAKDITWADSLAAEVTITPEAWYNVKYVNYISPISEKYVQEWYVNGALVRRGERATNYGTNLTKLIIEAPNTGSHDFYSYKNLKVYAVGSDVQLADSQAAKKTNPVLFATATGSTKMQVDNSIIALASAGKNTTGSFTLEPTSPEGPLMDVTSGRMIDGSKPYSVKFDLFMPECTDIAAEQTLQNFNFLSENTNSRHRYFGFMRVMPGRLKFWNTFNGSDEGMVVGKNAWHTVECVIEPANATADGSVYMTWFVDGAVARPREQLDSTQANTSETGIIKSFYGNSVVDGDPIKLDNIEICTQSYAHPDFALQPTLSQSGQNLIVSLNKAAESDIVLKNLIVKDESDETVAPTGITVAEDKMSATIALPAASNSQWYTVELPERMISADGYSLSKTQISTPHLEITTGELVTSGSNTSVNISYTNTTGDAVNGMVILAEYDGDRCVGVDIRNVTFNEAETATSVEADSLPSLTTNGSHTYRAYVWKANTIAPLSGAIVAK